MAETTTSETRGTVGQLSTIRVLLVEDREALAANIQGLLSQSATTSFLVERAATLAAGVRQLGEGEFDVVLVDLGLADGSGLGAVDQVLAAAPRLPVIALGDGDSDGEQALSAVRRGGQGYLTRERLEGDILIRAVRLSIERKRGVNTLLRAEEKYHRIFENLVEGIFQTTPDGHYLDANPALARIYGYNTPAELMTRVTDIAKSLYVEPGRREEFVREMELRDVVTGFASRIYRKDGSIIWITENVRAIRDANGKLVYYEGTVEDITERRHAQDQLENSETLYHSLVETLPQNIFRKDLSERFTFANQKFCLTLGKTLEEIIGKTDFDFFPAVLAAQYQKDDRWVMETGKTFQTIEENEPRGGEKIYVQVVKTPLHDAKGRIIGLQGIFWDITEEKKAQERERKALIELAASQDELRHKNNQLEADIRMAREIQMALLPQQYPTFRGALGGNPSALRFFHKYHPSGAVGGDFFYVLALSDTAGGVFICDVMGHDVRAALVTAMVRALVEELKPVAHDPGRFLTQLNRDLRAILKQTGNL
ncbi:MAG TPA: PAS domain S-box protein, partial [Verrucomicrobiae bacterium]|nr:PAS domain S-box protein [Verrucomicrobiae bacterium]